MSKIESLKLKLIEACNALAIDFHEVSDPVSETDDYINMTFAFSKESVVDTLIRKIRSSIAKFSPEYSLSDDIDDHDLICVLMDKSFIRSNQCWSLTVCLSDDRYEMRETTQA